jgi:DNA-binding protein HU-beta
MNNKEFISRLSDSADMTMAEAQRVADTIVNAMGRLFDDGSQVQIPSFGTFEVKKHKERIMVNPASGQRMLVPPKLILGFKPASAVRGQIKKGGEA